jgi:outer membrane murein-binding lipoprotein Lpp
MKKIRGFAAILATFCLICLGSACSDPSAALKKENEQLNRKLVELDTKNQDLSAKIAELEKEISQYTETPELMLEKAIKEKQSGHYDEAVKILELLMAKATGKPIVKTARDEIAAIAKLKQEMLLAEDRARRETFQDIGGGFAVRKITFRDSHGITEVVGEIKNSAGKDFIIAKFVIALYDAEGTLLSNSFIDFTSFPNGSVKTFSAYSEIPPKKISNCKVQLDKVI